MGKRLNHPVSDYVVFDLETTGLSTANDKVIEISAVKVRNGVVYDEFSSLVNPDMHIPRSASAVNNIYDSMVQDKPYFDEVLRDFLDFAGDDVLVGHNIARFDLKFIQRDAMKYYGREIDNDYVDTLSLAMRCLPGLSHYRLTDLASRFGISSDGAHRALADCRMNMKVYEYLKNEQSTSADEEGLLCPECGSPLKKRKGRFGVFYGCTGYPECRYTRKI